MEWFYLLELEILQEMENRVRYKLSDLTDDQLLKIFESVPSDEEVLGSSDDEDGDIDIVEALNTALEDAENMSFIDNNVENVQNNAQKAATFQKTAKRPRSPLPINEDSACASPPTSGGFNGAGKPNLSAMCYFSE